MNEHTYHRWNKLTIASGATRSSDLVIAGYESGSVIIPAAFKGTQIRWRNRQADTGTAGRVYDEVSTAIVQSISTFTRPLSMAIHPKVMTNCRIVNLCASSAQTGPSGKTIDVFLK